jgi:hypothetical protein
MVTWASNSSEVRSRLRQAKWAFAKKSFGDPRAATLQGGQRSDVAAIDPFGFAQGRLSIAPAVRVNAPTLRRFRNVASSEPIRPRIALSSSPSRGRDGP